MLCILTGAGRTKSVFDIIQRRRGKRRGIYTSGKHFLQVWGSGVVIYTRETQSIYQISDEYTTMSTPHHNHNACNP